MEAGFTNFIAKFCTPNLVRKETLNVTSHPYLLQKCVLPHTHACVYTRVHTKNFRLYYYIQ
jgi:hypothetical protein